jgi:methenyltetrahydrofolate cyclohydrolase
VSATVAGSLRTGTITDFLDALAAKVPAPGGGAAAALHLGQAAALVSMVARYTTGPRYAKHEELVTRICERADAARTRALRFADEDMAAFSAVMESYRLSKDTDAEAAARTAAIAAATKRAAAVPADVADAAAEVLTLAEDLLPVANRNVISDVAAAADAARAAATTARVNVEINIPGILDPLACESLLTRMKGVDDVLERADAVTAQVRKLVLS